MEKNGGTLISWVFHDVTDSTLGFQVKKLQTIQHARVLKGIVILNDEIRLMCLWEKRGVGLVHLLGCPCVGPSKFF